MRKPAFAYAKTKTQIRFTVTYIRNFKPLAIFCSLTAWFVSDLVGNPEDRFSDNEAHFILLHLP